MTKILAIETSCDETAAAVIEDGCYIHSNVVATQIDLHRRYGGVFPEVASRQHVSTLDGIAVTHGPGLSGSLLVGVNAAKGLAFGSSLPLLPINHLEGHIYSNWLVVADQPPQDPFPLLILIVSGGHTELILMTNHCEYQLLGSTLDDAAGEAFDKVARKLDLGFPGGPAIQRSAAQGDPRRFDLPRPLLGHKEHRFNFSFSGLKTAMLNLTRRLEREGIRLDDSQTVADLAASFQQAVVDVLIKKTMDAAVTFGAKQISICGGVSANGLLRQTAQQHCSELNLSLYTPPLFLCTDNAAMIGAAAFYRWQHNPSPENGLDVDVFANLPLSYTSSVS